MSDDQTLYEAIRRRVKARMERRSKFVSNTLIFIVVSVVLWAIWLITDPDWRMSVNIMLLLTGGFVVAFINEFVQFMMAEAEERAIQREIERERPWQLEMAGKVKRDARYMRLSDDGELVEMSAVDDEMDDKPKRPLEA